MEQYNFTHHNIHETIRCQRNFDWNNQVTPEHLAILDEYVQKPPQQCGERATTVIKIHNNFEKVYDLSMKLDKENWQIVAPLVYVWTSNDTQPDEKFFAGFHSGIVSKIANELGYQTGFCACGNGGDAQLMKHWSLANGLTDDNYHHMEFILSIGHGELDKAYNDNGSYVEDQSSHTHSPYNWPEVKEL